MRTIVCILFSTFCFAFISDKKEVKKEILALNKAFVNTKVWGLNISNSGINLTTNKPLKSTASFLIVKPERYFYKDEQTEVMANTRYKINVTHFSKKIIVSKLTDPKTYPQSLNNELLNSSAFNLRLDTVMDFYQSVDLKSVDATQNALSFIAKNKEGQKSVVIYNKTTYRVNKVEYFFNDGKADYKYNLAYSYLGDAELKTDKWFKESNYFDLVNGKPVLTAKYNGYKLEMK